MFIAPPAASDAYGVFAHVMVITCVFGGLGGFTQAVMRLSNDATKSTEQELAGNVPPGQPEKPQPEKPQAANAFKGMAFFGASIVVGIGGALAILLAVLIVGRQEDISKPYDLLTLATLTFVAGTIGHRLLPMVAANLENRIADAERKAERAVRKAKQVEKTTESIGNRAELNREVLTALQLLDRTEALPTIVEDTVGALTKMSTAFPLDRPLHIVLGRVLAEKNGRRLEAIQVLKKFIERKTIGNGKEDDDVAAAWFNIACYEALEMKGATEPLKARRRENALKALAESLRIQPSNAKDAAEDPDLDGLRELPQFKKLMAV